MENVKINLSWEDSQWLYFVNCYMVFDIKMEYFKRKAYVLVGGHATHMLKAITYSSMVTRETICIALPMAMLHDVEVKSEVEFNPSWWH